MRVEDPSVERSACLEYGLVLDQENALEVRAHPRVQEPRLHLSMCVCERESVCACACACVYLCLCVCVYVCACVCACVCVWTCV